VQQNRAPADGCCGAYPFSARANAVKGSSAKVTASALGRYCCKSLSGYEARNIDSSAAFTWQGRFKTLCAAERTCAATHPADFCNTICQKRTLESSEQTLGIRDLLLEPSVRQDRLSDRIGTGQSQPAPHATARATKLRTTVDVSPLADVPAPIAPGADGADLQRPYGGGYQGNAELRRHEIDH
jgi:hypothetical protein